MDVLNPVDTIELHDTEVKHIIRVPGYAGRTTDVVIFMDKKANTYYWVTTSFPGFKEGEICSIRAKCNRDRGNRLSFVKKIEVTADKKSMGCVKSEQKKPDARDVLLGLADYNKIML